MRIRYLLLAAIAVAAVVGAAACAPTPSPSSQPVSGAAGQPVAAVQMAPVCQGSTSCEVPAAELHQIDCVNKIPYTNVLVPPGTEFEVLDQNGDFTCRDSGNVVDGKTVLTCYGKELYTFDLKLTNTSCGGNALATGTGQCQDGYGYDSDQQCCAPAGGDAASTVISVDLGGCPLPRN